MEKMKVAVMTDVMKLQFVEREIPYPSGDDVLVKMEYVGVCGSDLHFFEHCRIGDCVVTPPFVLGHEAGGTVVSVGRNVKQLKPGDKVALEPGKTCGECEFCLTGRYNLCPDVAFFATPPVDGIFQEYAVHPAKLCFKIPPTMDTMQAALIEPLAVGFNAAQTGGAALGKTAIITGAGCIGLVSLLAAKALGTSQILVGDIIEKRLQMAEKLGSDITINSACSDLSEAVCAFTDRHGVDFAIETSGNESAANQAIASLKRGGTLVLVGYSSSGKMTLDISRALDKQLNIKTIFRYCNHYPLAIKAVKQGLDIKSIVSDVFEFDDIQAALKRSILHKSETVKTVIKF